MSIIYSYPEQGALNANDLLIGTSAEKVGGKQKNITRNFSVQQIADFINGGTGFIDPVASDFQIPVFNQGGTRITGSIISQDAFPNGTGVTISGYLTTTGNISTAANLYATGVVSLGSNQNLISLNSQTRLNGPILDTTGTIGSLNQILLSDSTGVVRWQNYEAGLTYEGTWDATNNTTNGLSNSPALISGQGVSGHFYIVNVAGSVDLDGNNEWHVGDWAVFLDQGGQPASWQKIDNTSALTGDGTAGVFAKWTDTTTLNDSLMSQAGTNILINGGLKVKDTVEATTTNSNIKLKGNGIGGVEIMSADGVTDGKITLNCSQNSHGVTLQSPPHGSGATYTLVLPTNFGGAGDVLTSAGANPSQLVWTTPTTGTVTNFTTVSTAIPGITTTVTNPTTTPGLTLSITGTPGAGLFLDGTGNWSSPGGGVTDITATAPLNADVATGSVTLSMPAYATATGGYVPSGGASGEYLDGLSGNWTSLPVSGVTSVTGDSVTISSTGGTTPVISAITTAGVSSISTSLATGAQIQTAIDTALAGTLTFKGTFNAATGLITSGVNNGLQLYTGTAGVIAITKGDFYIADTAGSFYNTTAMNVGDEAIALFTVAAAPPGSAITDWSVIPSQSAGGTVTGTGAATQVTFWDGTSNVNGDTAFNWDNTNKRLGVGTSSPAGKLTIADTAFTTAYDSIKGLFFDNSNISSGDGNFGAGIEFGKIGSLGNLYKKAAIIPVQSGTDSDQMGISFFVSNSAGQASPVIEAMRVDYGGNVGIGTSSPGAKLDVVGTGQVVSRVISTDNNGARFDLQSSGGGRYSQQALANGDFFMFDEANSHSVQRYFDGASGAWAWYTAGTEKMRITSTGQVKFNNYTAANSFTGTAVASLAVDSSGNIITEAAGSGGASTITTDNFPGDGTVGPFALTATPSGGSTSFVDVFIDGVYQEIATYTISGTALSFVTGSEPPTGTNIQTKTTSGAVSGALVSSVDIGQSTSTTGGVNLRINPIEVTSGTTEPGVANSLYIFTSTTGSISTLTLPASPTAGDSIKISNIGGLANVIATSGTDKIMGQAGPMTINVTNAAFELIWSNIAAQGWIIIGNV